ncbi:hypothetical protein J3B02_002300 [Coemansia erecta]|nr:hypothetical protein J3B02_002300 [Coemansia erecta]
MRQFLFFKSSSYIDTNLACTEKYIYEIDIESAKIFMEKETVELLIQVDPKTGKKMADKHTYQSPIKQTVEATSRIIGEPLSPVVERKKRKTAIADAAAAAQLETPKRQRLTADTSRRQGGPVLHSRVAGKKK